MDKRTFAERWADIVTEFSGSWPFIWIFLGLSVSWIILNVTGLAAFDPYPFLFLNWVLTVISTFQNPLIMLSNNRQNDVDRERMAQVLQELAEIKQTLKGLKDGSNSNS